MRKIINMYMYTFSRTMTHNSTKPLLRGGHLLRKARVRLDKHGGKRSASPSLRGEVTLSFTSITSFQYKIPPRTTVYNPKRKHLSLSY